MATRANVIIQKKGEKTMILYYHYDGYPKGVGQELVRYLTYLPQYLLGTRALGAYIHAHDGAYEETDRKAGDAEYQYVVDLDKMTLTCEHLYDGNVETMLEINPVPGSENIDLNKRKVILAKIRELEKIYLIHVLWCVESGSRAWGFASKDSDWDVRFVYVHRPEWYVRVEEQRDVIEVMDEAENLDMMGWELRKALRLFKQSNPSLLEWINSPIIYYQDPLFIYWMHRLEPALYNSIKNVHHYLNMATKHNDKYLQKKGFTLKKYLYFLRGLLAVKFIMAYRFAPPVEFETLLLFSPMDSGVREAILGIVRTKREGKEHDEMVVPDVLQEYGKKLLEECEKAVSEYRPEEMKHDVAEVLDRFMYQFVMK